MKAKKLIIKRWIDGKLIEKIEKRICGHCGSGEIYQLKKKKTIFCRKCQKESEL